MADQPTTLTAWRVGGQIDPAWLIDVAGLVGRTWENIRAVATLQLPTHGALPIVDPTNGAHISPLAVTHVLARDAVTGAPSDGQWITASLKVTTADDADDALQPTGLTWQIAVAVDILTGAGEQWTDVYTYRVTIDADRDYVAESETITVDGTTCIDINALITPPLTTPVATDFEAAVLAILAAGGYNPGGATPTYTLVAAENLTAGQVVNVFVDMGTSKARRADASLARPASGFAAATTTAGGTATVIDFGTIVGLTGLTPAADYWLGDTGTIVPVAGRPTTPGDIDQYIGFALTSTTLRVRLDPPTEIA